MDDKKHKGNWRSLLVGVVLGSVITIGAFTQVERTGFLVNAPVALAQEDGIEEEQEDSKQDENEPDFFSSLKKPLWDWLNLSSRLLVPILIFGFGLWFQNRDKKRAEEQDIRERELAKDNLAEEAIQAYLKSMGDILLNKEYRRMLFADDNSVRDIARALTIAILRKLEGDRRRQDVVLRFLRDAELHKFILKNAHLSEMDLSGTSLWDIDLSGARLRNTNLSKADLEETNLSKANLSKANLSKANLSKACLLRTNLSQADLSSANLEYTCWVPEERIREKAYEIWEKRKSEREPETSEDNWKEAKKDLKNNLREDREKHKHDFFNRIINFLKNDLYGPNLKDANLENANLKDANLKDANLKDANLKDAYLNEAKNLTPKQIKSAHNWKQAIYIGEFNKEKKIWEPIESDNKKFIKYLEDKSSDQEKPVDWSIWKNNNST